MAYGTSYADVQAADLSEQQMRANALLQANQQLTGAMAQLAALAQKNREFSRQQGLDTSGAAERAQAFGAQRSDADRQFKLQQDYLDLAKGVDSPTAQRARQAEYAHATTAVQGGIFDPANYTKLSPEELRALQQQNDLTRSGLKSEKAQSEHAANLLTEIDQIKGNLPRLTELGKKDKEIAALAVTKQQRLDELNRAKGTLNPKYFQGNVTYDPKQKRYISLIPDIPELTPRSTGRSTPYATGSGDHEEPGGPVDQIQDEPPGPPIGLPPKMAKVSVRGPDGATWNIPANRLQEAMARGATPIDQPQVPPDGSQFQFGPQSPAATNPGIMDMLQNLIPQGAGGMAGGGEVHGPGTGRSDSVLIHASDGEFVVPAAAVAMPGVLPMLQRLRLAGNLKAHIATGDPGHYARGGVVRRSLVDAYGQTYPAMHNPHVPTVRPPMNWPMVHPGYRLPLA